MSTPEMSEERPENLTNDALYELPSRRTVVRRIQTLYETERTTNMAALQRAPTVALTGRR